MFMNMGHVVCNNAALNRLRSGPTFPKEAGTRTEAYEARCLDIIKGYLDTRRPILASKGGDTCVPDTDVSYHEDGNEILFRYPILPTSGTNKEMARPNQASVVNVVATVVIVLSLIPVYVSQRLSRTENEK